MSEQVREHNEDAVLVKEVGQDSIAGNDFRGLYIVSDGMGGAEAGEVASQIAIQTLARHVEAAWAEAEEEVDAAAWERCLREAGRDGQYRDCPIRKRPPRVRLVWEATIVAVLIQAGQLALAWIGDSRVYLLENGALHQLSHDHSLVARLVEIGQLTEEEALTHEHRNVLIRSLGSKENVKVDTLSRPLKRGARLLPVQRWADQPCP